MLELLSYVFFDLFLYVICRGLGYLTVFIFSFGQSRCDPNTADIVGALVLMGIIIVLVLWLWR